MSSRADALKQAVGHHSAGRLSEAEAIYRRVLEDNPWHLDALHLLGVVAHQTGRHELAVQYIGQAVIGNATVPLYHNSLGEAFRALGHNSQARDCYNEALKLDPTCGPAHYHLGLLAFELGDAAEAVRHYERAAELQPDHALTHNNLGNALRAQGKQAESVAAYEKALVCDPNCAEARLNLCDALMALARIDEAIVQLETAHKQYIWDTFRRALPGTARPKSGPSAEVCLKLGCAYAASERWDRAIWSFEEALRLQPDFAEARCGLGNALWASGDVAAGETVLEEAARQHPEHVDSLVQYSKLLESQGRVNEARALADRAARIETSAARQDVTPAERQGTDPSKPREDSGEESGDEQGLAPTILCTNASHQHRCIFIHIPKNAGTSIKRVLDMPGGGHFPWRYYAEDHPRLWRDYTSFAVVRNPWDRMVSAYHHARMKTSYWQYDLTGLHADYELLADKSFDQCVRILYHQRNRLQHFAWVQQAYFLLGPETDDREIMIDFVLRYETLADDFAELRRKLQIDCEPLPRVNESPRSHDYRSYYNDETRRLIEDYYRVDIEVFGYSF